jgi:endonuclease YncB( thermonuclease family)
MSRDLQRCRLSISRGTALLALAAVVLAGLVAGMLAYRGMPDAVSGRLAQAPKLPTIITGPSPNAPQPLTGRIFPTEITVIDGDTIKARGRTIRLVGFDAPESGLLARCARAA